MGSHDWQKYKSAQTSRKVGSLLVYVTNREILLKPLSMAIDTTIHKKNTCPCHYHCSFSHWLACNISTRGKNREREPGMAECTRVRAPPPHWASPHFSYKLTHLVWKYVLLTVCLDFLCYTAAAFLPKQIRITQISFLTKACLKPDL